MVQDAEKRPYVPKPRNLKKLFFANYIFSIPQDLITTKILDSLFNFLPKMKEIRLLSPFQLWKNTFKNCTIKYTTANVYQGFYMRKFSRWTNGGQAKII